MNQYQQIAGEFASQIEAGALLPGGKLPSVRELARLRGISPTTASEAYELLKLRGAIEARPRSGYFVSKATLPPLHLPERNVALLPSASAASEDLLQDMLTASNDALIFPFGAAIPAASYLPAAALNRLMRKTLRNKPELLAAYRFAPGSLSLRETLALRYQRLGVKLTAKAIVTTAGAIEAIGLALSAVAEPGATVALEAPTYPGIFQLVRSMGYRVLEIPLDATRGLTPEALQSALSKARGSLKAVVSIPNFSNPLGTCVSDVDKQELVRIASREGIVLVEDDIYGDLAYSRARPKPLKAYDKDDSVILCTSFSKTISPALRVGCAISAKYAHRLGALKYARGSGVSALSEEVLQQFLERGSYERHLAKVRGDYQTLMARYSREILQQFPAGTRVAQPEGGFILWVELPQGVDSVEVQKSALRRRISVAPGSIFSDDGTHYRNYIRLNCAIPWTPAAQKALGQLARICAEQVVT